MRNRTILWSAFFLATMILPAAAAPAWPEAHSGAYLGVQMKVVTPERASVLKLKESSGAVITYVDQDGPACRAGLMENDVIVGFNGAKVDNPGQLQGLIHTSTPEKPVTLTIVRNGERKDVKVTLGSWSTMSHSGLVPAAALGYPPPPHAITPDIEIPSYTAISARHGLVVESMTPQLADYFGSGRGRGVLVRSVESGSPAAAAGIRAGDVIVKVNNQEVHDMADWQKGMQSHGSKVPVAIWREKREVKVVINLPSDDNSRLQPGDWLNFDPEVLQGQLEEMRPEIERSQEMVAQMEPSQKEMDQMRREMEKSMKQQQKEMEKMSHKLAASAEFSQKEMAKMQREMQKSMPSQKDLAEMKRQIQQSMPSQKDIDAMKEQIQASMPTQQQVDEMRHQIETSMQNWTPQLQHEMQEMQKQMEQQKLDLQKMMQDFNNQYQF
jgi:membrane-associated protease RseP (regulator of RpoE activity)